MFGFGKRRRALEAQVAALVTVARELQSDVAEIKGAKASFEEAGDELRRIATENDETLERLEIKRRRLTALESKARARGELPPVDGEEAPTGMDRLTQARMRARERGYVS